MRLKTQTEFHTTPPGVCQEAEDEGEFHICSSLTHQLVPRWKHTYSEAGHGVRKVLSAVLLQEND